MDLRRLIVVLTVCSAAIPFAHTFYASYAVQREQLVANALESNYAYATKLAKSTDDFLQAALQQLAFTAGLLSQHMGDAQALGDEATRLRLQTQSFNSVTIHDAAGRVLATSPENLLLKGQVLRSDAVRQAIATQQPLISAPYESAAGHYHVVLSHPVHSPDGRYLGAVGGSIYLKHASILNRLLGTHYHQDGSYLYVVDKDQYIIYHPDVSRVGERIAGNGVIDQVVAGHAGMAPVTNSRGQAMLAGFAVVPTTGWGVVAQRPASATLAPLDNLVRNMLLRTLPVVVVMLVLIAWGARRIAQPLRQLANAARALEQPDTSATIQAVPAWYYEAQELKKAMLTGMGQLQNRLTQLREDVHTDPLTGLSNRRHLAVLLEQFQAQRTPFAVVSLDIDHFKRVNDSFGHDVGDTVLQKLALQMREVCREGDVPCRVGGEEFVVLLPQASTQAATQVAERLRCLVERTELPQVGHITISLGVAQWPTHGADVAAVFKAADEMLYRAKRGGRNRTEVYGSADMGLASTAAEVGQP